MLCGIDGACGIGKGATSADYRSVIHTEVHYAEEITWGILPYVPYQYEK